MMRAVVVVLGTLLLICGVAWTGLVVAAVAAALTMYGAVDVVASFGLVAMGVLAMLAGSGLAGSDRA